MAENGELPTKAEGFDYEDAWAARLALVRDKIAAGEDKARYLLAALQRQERFFTLWTQPGLPPRWAPRRADPGVETWPPGNRMLRPSSLRGAFAWIPAYAEFRVDTLLADIAESHGPFDVIAELGCGYGRNLFDLYDAHPDRHVRYVGGEYMAPGIDLAREIAGCHEAGERFTFTRFDHMQPDLSLVGPARRVMIVTVHSIEQVQRLPTDYFHRLAQAAPEVVGVHIEPFGHQVNAGLGPATREQVKLFANRRWNGNMHHIARRAAADGVIAIDQISLECCLPTDPINPSSLLVWHRT
jgi:SAM-dependent methyltransferase